MKLTAIDGGKRDEKPQCGVLAFISANTTDAGGTLTEATFLRTWAALMGKRHLRSVK